MTLLANGEFVPLNELKKAYFIDDDGENKGLKLLPDDGSYIFETCECCGDTFAYNNTGEGLRLNAQATDIEETYICPNCIDDYFICGDCDCWAKKIDRNYIVDIDEDICENCFDSGDYFICDDCGDCFSGDVIKSIHHTDGSFTYVCNSCYYSENYASCEICGNTYPTYEMTEASDSHNFFCQNCDYNLYHCYDCDELFEYGSSGHEEDGEWYCNECRSPRDITINEYGFKPDPIFKRLPIEQENKEFFGFEIEVDGDTDYAEDFLEAFGDTTKEEIYLKRDSSVNGFEIVTHPMTRTYIDTEFRKHLESGMRFLIDNEFRGHNRGGIHIHVSREAISDEQLVKMHQLLFCDKNKAYSRKKYNKWLAITQRKDFEMERWADMRDYQLQSYSYYSTRRADVREWGIRTIKKRLDEGEIQLNLHDSRYRAINLENKKTIEFRIFNSNLRVDRIMKDAQVIFSLIDFTATKELPTMRNYLNFVMRNSCRYKEFADFLIEKNIVPNPVIVEKQRKLINQVRLAVEDEIYINTMRDVQNYINSLLIDITDVGRNENERITERCA